MPVDDVYEFTESSAEIALRIPEGITVVTRGWVLPRRILFSRDHEPREFVPHGNCFCIDCGADLGPLEEARVCICRAPREESFPDWQRRAARLIEQAQRRGE